MLLRSIHILLVVIALLVYKTGRGQGGLPQIIIKNELSGMPIAQVHAFNAATGQLWVSDKDGSIQLKDLVLPAALRLSHVGYEDHALTLEAIDLPKDAPLIVTMMPRMVMLDPVEISVPGPEIVYQREDLHVGAFHINSDGIWVLVYEKPQLFHRQENAGQQVLKGARLHLLDTLFQEKAAHLFPTTVRGLQKDHLHRVIIAGAHEAWIAEATHEGIGLGWMDAKTLKEAVLPWTGTINGLLIGSDLVETYPAFDHLIYDPATKETRTICTVQDDHLMELFRSQYKYMSGRDKVIAMDLSAETGVDSEIIAGHMTGFHTDMYYKVPYAPLFVVNDTICVFDHYREQIRKFDRDLEEAGEVPITHHLDRTWKNELIQDPVDQRIYAIHKKGPITTLRTIDPTTGEIGPSFSLQHHFPEEVKVYGGSVYYVYRPFGSLQHRSLYRERLK